MKNIFIIIVIALATNNLNAASCVSTWTANQGSIAAEAVVNIGSCEGDMFCEHIYYSEYLISSLANDVSLGWCCLLTPDPSC